MLGLMVLLVALANSVLACSGDGSTPCKNIVNSGTTAGAYTVTVTGTSGTTTAADVVTLTVE
jgi:hypothetical protein